MITIPDFKSSSKKNLIELGKVLQGWEFGTEGSDKIFIFEIVKSMIVSLNQDNCDHHDAFNLFNCRPVLPILSISMYVPIFSIH